MDLNIEGNTALVLASSSGLGFASAKALVENGANVVINGRDKEKLNKAVRKLKEIDKGDVLGLQGNLMEKNNVKSLVDKTIEEYGGLDHLVTCVGGPPSKPFIETTDEEWYRAYDGLVMSVVWSIKEAYPHLYESEDGTIVNITSISVKESIEGLVLSNSVRMAVIGLMKTISREFGPDIRINAVLPGYTETSRVRELIEDSIERGDISTYEEGLEQLTKDVPLNRIGKPKELGDLVAFLSSSISGYINGAAIPIDGGSSRSNL